MEKGEIAIVLLQFGALIIVVLILANFTPGQSAQSQPVVGTVFWGAPNQNVALSNGALTKVSQNNSMIVAYFSVAFSTQVSSVSASRLCVNTSSGAGESTFYTNITFGHDQARQSSYVTISPTNQQRGWDCTYTIKITDQLSQSADLARDGRGCSSNA